jgi:hypothetical protein
MRILRNTSEKEGSAPKCEHFTKATRGGSKVRGVLAQSVDASHGGLAGGDAPAS